MVTLKAQCTALVKTPANDTHVNNHSSSSLSVSWAFVTPEKMEIMCMETFSGDLQLNVQNWDMFCMFKLKILFILLPTFKMLVIKC